MANETQQPRRGGGCLCGAVRFTLDGGLADVSICHCHMCQRAGTLGGAYTACAPDQLSFAQGADRVTWYRSSETARRGFCGTCGSQLFWEPASGEHLSVSAGALDQPTGLRTGRALHADSIADYVRSGAAGVGGG